jgi:hypothetical protein
MSQDRSAGAPDELAEVITLLWRGRRRREGIPALWDAPPVAAADGETSPGVSAGTLGTRLPDPAGPLAQPPGSSPERP